MLNKPRGWWLIYGQVREYAIGQREAEELTNNIYNELFDADYLKQQAKKFSSQ